jgi:hypothetical protein
LAERKKMPNFGSPNNGKTKEQQALKKFEKREQNEG